MRLYVRDASNVRKRSYHYIYLRHCEGKMILRDRGARDEKCDTSRISMSTQSIEELSMWDIRSRIKIVHAAKALRAGSYTVRRRVLWERSHACSHATPSRGINPRYNSRRRSSKTGCLRQIHAAQDVTPSMIDRCSDSQSRNETSFRSTGLNQQILWYAIHIHAHRLRQLPVSVRPSVCSFVRSSDLYIISYLMQVYEVSDTRFPVCDHLIRRYESSVYTAEFKIGIGS